jgi:tRNA threonylcarbamoyladenosine biosynthesis protein TsaE
VRKCRRLDYDARQSLQLRHGITVTNRRTGTHGETDLREFLLHNPEETIALGERLGRAVAGGTIIGLRGGLGAGKTTFAKGFARGLGITDEVTSPTYTIISEYEGRLRLHHIDAYRLSGPEDFDSVGGEDLFADSGGVCLIEWSERIQNALPRRTAVAELLVEADGSRILRLESVGLEALLQ